MNMITMDSSSSFEAEGINGVSTMPSKQLNNSCESFVQQLHCVRKKMFSINNREESSNTLNSVLQQYIQLLNQGGIKPRAVVQALKAYHHCHKNVGHIFEGYGSEDGVTDLEKIGDIIVIYCNLKFNNKKAKISPTMDHIVTAQRIIDLMELHLDGESEHIDHVLLKLRNPASLFAKIVLCKVFEHFLDIECKGNLTDIEYARKVLAFRVWKKLAEANRKNSIREKASKILKAPPGFLNNPELYLLLSPISSDDVTTYLMQKYNKLENSVQAYFKYIESRKNKLRTKSSFVQSYSDIEEISVLSPVTNLNCSKSNSSITPNNKLTRNRKLTRKKTRKKPNNAEVTVIISDSEEESSEPAAAPPPAAPPPLSKEDSNVVVILSSDNDDDDDDVQMVKELGGGGGGDSSDNRKPPPGDRCTFSDNTASSHDSESLFGELGKSDSCGRLSAATLPQNLGDISGQSTEKNTNRTSDDKSSASTLRLFSSSDCQFSAATIRENCDLVPASSQSSTSSMDCPSIIAHRFSEENNSLSITSDKSSDKLVPEKLPEEPFNNLVTNSSNTNIKNDTISIPKIPEVIQQCTIATQTEEDLERERLEAEQKQLQERLSEAATEAPPEKEVAVCAEEQIPICEKPMFENEVDTSKSHTEKGDHETRESDYVIRKPDYVNLPETPPSDSSVPNIIPSAESTDEHYTPAKHLYTIPEVAVPSTYHEDFTDFSEEEVVAANVCLDKATEEEVTEEAEGPEMTVEVEASLNDTAISRTEVEAPKTPEPQELEAEEQATPEVGLLQVAYHEEVVETQHADVAHDHDMPDVGRELEVLEVEMVNVEAELDSTEDSALLDGHDDEDDGVEVENEEELLRSDDESGQDAEEETLDDSESCRYPVYSAQKTGPDNRLKLKFVASNENLSNDQFLNPIDDIVGVIKKPAVKKPHSPKPEKPVAAATAIVESNGLKDGGGNSRRHTVHFKPLPPNFDDFISHHQQQREHHPQPEPTPTSSVSTVSQPPKSVMEKVVYRPDKVVVNNNVPVRINLNGPVNESVPIRIPKLRVRFQSPEKTTSTKEKPQPRNGALKATDFHIQSILRAKEQRRLKKAERHKERARGKRKAEERGGLAGFKNQTPIYFGRLPCNSDSNDSSAADDEEDESPLSKHMEELTDVDKAEFREKLQDTRNKYKELPHDEVDQAMQDKVQQQKKPPGLVVSIPTSRLNGKHRIGILAQWDKLKERRAVAPVSVAANASKRKQDEPAAEVALNANHLQSPAAAPPPPVELDYENKFKRVRLTLSPPRIVSHVPRPLPNEPPLLQNEPPPLPNEPPPLPNEPPPPHADKRSTAQRLAAQLLERGSPYVFLERLSQQVIDEYRERSRLWQQHKESLRGAVMKSLVNNRSKRGGAPPTATAPPPPPRSILKQSSAYGVGSSYVPSFVSAANPQNRAKLGGEGTKPGKRPCIQFIKDYSTPSSQVGTTVLITGRRGLEQGDNETLEFYSGNQSSNVQSTGRPNTDHGINKLRRK